MTYTKSVRAFEPLQEGQVLMGTVTNVTNFGAFVDIGVHQDGLVHISELSHEFIKNPADVVSVGDQVKVKVIGVDKERKRISLSKKGAEEKLTAVKSIPQQQRGSEKLHQKQASHSARPAAQNSQPARSRTHHAEKRAEKPEVQKSKSTVGDLLSKFNSGRL
jgi:uncharacterized protein